MKLSELIKLHIQKRLPAIIASVVICALFSIYYFGILDVSFIERPRAWKDNLSLYSEMVSPHTEKVDKEEEPKKEETGHKKPDKETEKVPPEDTEKPQPDQNTPSYQMPTYLTVDEMEKQGYYRTDKVFDDSCVFAKLVCEYSWPKEFSYSWKTYDKEIVTTYDDGTESTVRVEKKSGERAAIELYMGYIIYDDDEKIYLIGPDGAVLTEYNDKEFVPAYTRDKEGRPLFYKYKEVTEKYPVVLGKKKEDGTYEWKKTAKLTFKDKVYYYLAENGKTFKEAEYNDATDNRGLYFDYPTYYGTTDSKLSRYYLNTTRFFTPLKGETTILDNVFWTYSKDKLKLSDFKFDSDGFLITDNEKDKEKTKKDLFPYTSAYNYSEKYAAVFMDIDWTYDHDVKNAEGKVEKKTFDVTTNELRIINEKGEVMFESRKNFFSELKWTAHEKYSRPLLSGISSIGSYYFDHGLMRLRIQSWDCYYFAEFDTVKIVTDDDVLVRPNGDIYQLPTGYTLVSYSDGIILLEKDGKYGYMNYLGNWIRDPELLDASPFVEGVAVCKNEEGNYGVIDTEGKAVIPFIYKYVSNISGGNIAAYSESTGWTVYQKMTK